MILQENRDATALWDAILRCPDDMVARHAFADWCEENDDPRAAFMRSGLRHGQTQPNLDVRDDGCYSDEEKALTDNFRLWLGDVPSLMIPGSVVGLTDFGYGGGRGHVFWHWRFGMLDEITCTMATWWRCGPNAVKCHPIRHVVMIDKSPACYLDGDFGWQHYGSVTGGDEWPRNLRYQEFQPDIIPTLIFDLIDLPSAGGCQKTTPYKDLAKDALGKACLLWARRRAGLEA